MGLGAESLFRRACVARRESVAAREKSRALCATLLRFTAGNGVGDPGRVPRAVVPEPPASGKVLVAARPPVVEHRPVAAAVVATVRTNGSGKILQASETVSRWLNVPVERLAGSPLLHYVGRRDTGAFRTLVKTLGYGSSYQAVTVRFRPRGGAQQLVSASVANVGPNTYEWTLRAVPSSSDKKDE